MHNDRFDDRIRSLAPAGTRRGMLRGLAAAIALTLGHAPGASRGRRRKRKPPRRNEFGCVPVGGKCRGRDAACCSGLCRGTRPKQGTKDRSRCVGHDASTCQRRQQSGTCGGTIVNCATTAGRDGTCQTTTGNAAYCAFRVNCFACRRDADCQDRIDTPRAACIRCAGCLGGTTCAFIE